MIKVKIIYMNCGTVKGYITEVNEYDSYDLSNAMQRQNIQMQDLIRIERILRPDPVDIFDDTIQHT